MLDLEKRRESWRNSSKKWAANNPQKVKERTHRWRSENIDLVREQNNRRAKDAHIKNKYGLTRTQFNDLLTSQGGVCAICGTNTPGGRGQFHVDHCHQTGVIRGLLCHYCNNGLGNFRDNIGSLESAVNYLRRVKMARFVFVPEDGGPHRLFRWVSLPDGKLAIYDEMNNLVLIDKKKFDALTTYQKSRVLRTRTNLNIEEPLAA